MKDHEPTAPLFRPQSAGPGRGYASPPDLTMGAPGGGFTPVNPAPSALEIRREQEQRQTDQLWRQLCIQQAVAAAAGKAWTCEDVAILAERFYAFGTNR